MVAARFQDLITRGPIFVPRWGSYLGRLEQRPTEEIFENPILLCMTLRRTQQLFGLSGICIDLPPERIIGSNPLKMLGTRGNFQIMLEAFQGLSRIVEPEVGLFGHLLGPGYLSLATPRPAAMTEPAWFEWCREIVFSLIRRLGEENIFTAVFIDESMINLSEFSADHRQSLRAIFNLLTFYELPALLIRQPPPEEATDSSGLDKLNPMAIIIQTDRATVQNDPLFPGFTGRALSPKLLLSGNDVVLRTVGDMLNQGVVLVTTAGEVPPTIEPRTIHDLSKRIHGHT